MLFPSQVLKMDPLMDQEYLNHNAGERQPLLASSSDLESIIKETQLKLSLLRKLDRRMSILFLMHMLNCIDKNIISVARLWGFEEELHLEGRQFAILLAAFHFAYLFMPVPSNIFLQSYGKSSMFLPLSMVSWGIVTIGAGFVKNFPGALCARILLGFLQATFYPGALLLLSRWYKPDELSERLAYMSCGGYISDAFGSLIASGIFKCMDGISGLSAWRWLFILEGTVTIAVAIGTFFVVPDLPDRAPNWLQPEERRLAITRVAHLSPNSPENSSSGIRTSKTQWTGMFLAISDPKVWWLSIILLCFNITQSFKPYFPTLCATLGYGRVISLLLCAPPWLYTTGTSLYLSRHSDKVGERFAHITFPILICMLGFILAKSSMIPWIRYISLFLVAQGSGAAICFMAWSNSSLVADPPARHAVSLAMINGISQFGNIIGSFAWPPSWGPTYNPSFSMCIWASVLMLGMCLSFKLYLTFINRGAELLEAEEGVPKGVRYML